MARLTMQEIQENLAEGQPASIAVVGTCVRELAGHVDDLGKAVARLFEMFAASKGGVKSAPTTVAGGEAKQAPPRRDVTAAEDPDEFIRAGMVDASEDSGVDPAVHAKLTEAANSSLKTANAIMDAAIASMDQPESATAAPEAPAAQAAPTPPPPAPTESNGKGKGKKAAAAPSAS